MLPSPAAEHSVAGVAAEAAAGANRYNSMRFIDACRAFEKLAAISRRNAGSGGGGGAARSGRKNRLLETALPRSFRRADKFGNASPYPYVRLLMPQLDTRDRDNYGMQTAKLTAAYVAALGHDPKKSRFAKRLKQYKKPGRYGGEGVGDYALILFEQLQRKTGAGGELTVGDINETLDELTAASDQAGRLRIVRRLLQVCSALEHKWLARIILKDMKVGLRHDRLLHWIHPDAVAMYSHTTNLKAVCELLQDSSQRHVPRLSLFDPLLPMLAQRRMLRDSGKQLAGVRFVAEPKFDGERCLCHKKGDVVEFFTRNGNNYTAIYGPVLSSLVLAHVQARDVILDGEILAWDSQSGRFAEFGTNRTVALAQQRRECGTAQAQAAAAVGFKGGGFGEMDPDLDVDQCWMCFMVFDVLYAEGGANFERGMAALARGDNISAPASMARTGNIMALPLEARRELLRFLVPDQVPTRLELVAGEVLEFADAETCTDELRKMLEHAMAQRLEGLVLKDMLSPYVTGETGRKLGYWRKLKPDHAEMLDSFDLLVLGVYYGERTGAMRAKGIGDFSHFLCGGLMKKLHHPAVLQRREDSVGGDEDSSAAGASVSAPRLPPDQEQELLHQAEWFTFAKVGSGYSFRVLQSLRERLRPHLQPYDHKAPPPHLRHWKPGKVDDRPAFWIPPQHSVVLEVQGSEVRHTDQFSAGCTFRFPHVAKDAVTQQAAVRDDKPWFQVDCLADITHVLQSGIGTSQAAQKRKAERACRGAAGDCGGRGGKKRKARQRTATRHVLDHFAPPVLPPSPAGASLESGDAASATSTVETSAAARRTLDGVCLCVLPATAAHASYGSLAGDSDREGGAAAEPADRAAVQTLALRHGARVVMAVGAAVTHVIGSWGTPSLQLQNLVRAGSHDVLSVEWLIRCVASRALLLPEPAEFIFRRSPGQKAGTMVATWDEPLNRHGADEYCDQYCKASTARQLSIVLARVAATESPGKKVIPGTLGAVAALESVQREPQLRLLVQKLQRENDVLRVPVCARHFHS